MNTTLRSSLAALLCAGSTGCAILPAVGLNLAAQGAQGLVALALGPMVDLQERSETDRCTMFAGRGISVSESLEAKIPAGEGEVRMLEPAYWRPEFAREGYPQVEHSRTSTEGALAITDRAVVFVPPPGVASVRIPYELVQSVDVRPGVVPGVPHSLIVRSCSGRFDIVTFGQRQPENPDPMTTAEDLKARVAAFQAKAGR